MSTDYTNVNGYLVPSFALPTGSTPPLGKYGAMRARFLDEHRSFERDQMLLDGTLAQHLAGIDSEAHNQVSALVHRLAEQRGVSEDLKQHHPLEWAAQMQALQVQAEEIVCCESIYALLFFGGLFPHGNAGTSPASTASCRHDGKTTTCQGNTPETPSLIL